MKKAERGRRPTIYAEATEDDRRGLTITAAMLDVEKGDIIRGLIRRYTSDSPNTQDLDELREIVDKYA